MKAPVNLIKRLRATKPSNMTIPVSSGARWIGVAFAFVLSLALVPAAHAAQVPEEFVAKLADDAFSTLRDTSLSETARLEKFRALLSLGVDLPRVGRFVLGQHWRRANTDQQKEYQALFSEYVIASYAGRLKEYTTSKVVIKKAADNGNGEYLVTSIVTQPGNPAPIRVEWRLREDHGQLRVIDLIIEGISMALSQRSEFSSLISSNGGDLTVLLARLRDVASTIQTADAPTSLTQ